ncbi:MAG: hypothetical protein J6328_03990 [Bacilli bacterium]|nr:hypothetical protein [Bacilli bacterium]
MKRKALTLAMLGVFALGACAETEPATNESIAKMKEALALEAAKTEAGYTITGSVNYDVKVGSHTLMDFKLKGLDANFAYRAGNGNDGKAYASLKYTEFKLNAYNEDTYEKEFGVETRDAGNHAAIAYVDNNNLYLDISALGIDSITVEGEDQPVENGKFLIPGFTSEAEDAALPMDITLGMSEDEFDEFVLKRLFTFRKDGEATEAKASCDASTFKDIYLTSDMARWYTEVRPTIDPDFQEEAMVAARNRYSKQFDAIFKTFKVEVGLKYNSKGLVNATLKTNGTIDLSALENGASISSEAMIVNWNIDVALRSSKITIPESFDTAGYTAIAN